MLEKYIILIFTRDQETIRHLSGHLWLVLSLVQPINAGATFHLCICIVQRLNIRTLTEGLSLYLGDWYIWSYGTNKDVYKDIGGLCKDFPNFGTMSLCCTMSVAWSKDGVTSTLLLCIPWYHHYTCSNTASCLEALMTDAFVWTRSGHAVHEDVDEACSIVDIAPSSLSKYFVADVLTRKGRRRNVCICGCILCDRWAVKFFSKLNKLFFGYFNSINIFFDNNNKKNSGWPKRCFG